MTILKLSIILLIMNCVASEDVEFYPSQSLLDNIQSKLINKRSIETKDSEFLTNNSTITSNSNIRLLNSNNVFWRHFNKEAKGAKKRATDPVFHGHPKTREELWNENIPKKSSSYDQTPSLIKLIHNITKTHLNECVPVILYDNEIKQQESYLFQNLFRDFPVTYVHGYIDDKNKLKQPKLLVAGRECVHYIVFLYDVSTSAFLLGKQSESKVVIVARSSQWAVQEFLSGPLSKNFINLLVIGQSFKTEEDERMEAPYILYTHKLYVDGLGTSKPVVLNSWSHGKYSRNVDLFPPKMTRGYAGHRFIVAAANQPPFVFKRITIDADGGNVRVVWDGIEIRLLKLLADRNNFSIEIVEPREQQLGPGDAVAREVTAGRADIGMAGLYVTDERIKEMDISFSHSRDCAAFITLMSTALPRYRAILGPFHWHVWVALTFTYLIGIFPLAFSDKHTLRHLIHNAGEVENMFWYVFGTFTNCFTFVGRNSWSKTTKNTTRLLIGMYWVFTIIITSCYTGCIIAFVTLPVYPETIDTIRQLLGGFFRVGTLDHGGWERWFLNSSDPYTNKLLRKLELVSNVEAGIRNTTKGFFWSYAFLGSRAELEYIVQANFSTTKSKRAMLHISNECFVPFGVSLAFPNNSLYTAKLSNDIRRMFQSGLMKKIIDEVRWEIQRSSTGKLLSVINVYIAVNISIVMRRRFLPLSKLQVGTNNLKIISIEEQGLTLEDTQGMFLLLAAGFIIAGAALISEWMGGCSRKCHFRRNKTQSESVSSESNLNRTLTTPKSDIQSDIKVIDDRSDSRLKFDSRSTSAESKDTLEGEIIKLTEENIIVHERLEADSWNSRRSSSIDLDKEVQRIFERDQKRRRISSASINDDRTATASKDAFGDYLKS